MEIRQGIVRNYVVTDREKFCDAMASSLCKMGISYVQIENELFYCDRYASAEEKALSQGY